MTPYDKILNRSSYRRKKTEGRRRSDETREKITNDHLEVVPIYLLCSSRHVAQNIYTAVDVGCEDPTALAMSPPLLLPHHLSLAMGCHVLPTMTKTSLPELRWKRIVVTVPLPRLQAGARPLDLGRNAKSRPSVRHHRSRGGHWKGALLLIYQI